MSIAIAANRPVAEAGSMSRRRYANGRAALKRLAYRSGALGALHRLRNRRRLTVAMFHRVLPETSPQWRDADPTYTVSDRLFVEVLAFFRRHYNVVPLEAVLAAA